MFLLFVCVALRGQKSMQKQHLRIQEGHFLKSALNLDLTLSDDGKCPALLKSSGIIDLGAFCVELWSFYCSKRILVPMSYIPWLYAHRSQKTLDLVGYLVRFGWICLIGVVVFSWIRCLVEFGWIC